VTAYTYGGPIADDEEVIDWETYRRMNRLADIAYEWTKDTIDARYNPGGGGSRWPK